MEIIRGKKSNEKIIKYVLRPFEPPFVFSKIYDVKIEFIIRFCIAN